MKLPPDYTEAEQWPLVLDRRSSIRSAPAVYALLHERPFGRLYGESSILYIGSTGQLGGNSDKCRLRIYRYPNGRHALELNRRLKVLVNAGVKITLFWKYFNSKDCAATEEIRLLQNYMHVHGELPPFNRRNEHRCQTPQNQTILNI